jgi:hypothetical protein
MANTDATRTHGSTAQQWSTGGGVVNSSAVQAHGNPKPEDQRPGYYGPGRPWGRSDQTLVPGGVYGAANQIQTVAPNAASLVSMLSTRTHGEQPTPCLTP